MKSAHPGKGSVQVVKARETNFARVSHNNLTLLKLFWQISLNRICSTVKEGLQFD